MDADESGAGGVSGATLSVGPTSKGMVRILVEDGGREMPMDFEPDEAEEIAGGLRAGAGWASAAAARSAGGRPAPERSARSERGGRRR